MHVFIEFDVRQIIIYYYREYFFYHLLQNIYIYIILLSHLSMTQQAQKFKLLSESVDEMSVSMSKLQCHEKLENKQICGSLKLKHANCVYFFVKKKKTGK